MQTKRRALNWQRRLWATVLAAVLACIPMVGIASATSTTSSFIEPEKAAPKPTVSIVGNVVVDKNKPTGFYELSLRVKTARTITTEVDGVVTEVKEEEYLKEIEKDPKNAENYTIKNYPFQSAEASVWINTDVLTAVTWGAGKPIYNAWNSTSFNGDYSPDKPNPSEADKKEINDYPKGIDLTNEDQPKIFTNLYLDEIKSGERVMSRLDTAHPDEMTNATALIEKVVGKFALLTLTASTTTTQNVVYDKETPVVVVRFAYDMNRFTKLDVGNPDDGSSEPNNSDFWLGLDEYNRSNRDKQASLTFLSIGGAGSGVDPNAVSDEAAAEASVHQTVWYAQNMQDDNMKQETTHFYYYLGADEDPPAKEGTTRSYQVWDGTAVTTMSLHVPKTAGEVVLANVSENTEWRTAGDPDVAKGYSFFQNLLTMGKGLKLKLVNAETYRKPTGSGGTTILFYDWDDSLIGSLVVDKGDVRAEVNEYVEKNLIHPDLRASQFLTNGKVPEANDDPNKAVYTNLVNSLDRDYTYRGKYAYTVGEEDNVGKDGDTENKARANGEDYPLTNKLDYAFYRRVNRVVEKTDENEVRTSYYSTSSPLDANNVDAALYPYVYGWAVVEDTSKTDNWKVMYDAAKTQDVWTTMGVGELATAKPGVGVTSTKFPTGLTIADVTEPAFIAYETAKILKKDPDAKVPAPEEYQYTTASTAANKYFRFADFSDIDAELARYKKADGDTKDTLIVKAVYEPGKSLMDGNDYRLIKRPVYSKFNSKTASAGAAYRAQITLERSYIHGGQVRGTSRLRFPELQMDTTTDYKWLTSDDPEVNHNLENATLQTSLKRTETTYIKVDVDNGEQVTFNLSLSARMNKVDYVLVESYAANFVGGTQRSETNNIQTGENFIPDNYNYLASDSVSPPGDDYYDCDYDTRSGSRGFVLLGTIGHMMENATQLREGEVTQLTFENAVSYNTARDINLRVDSAKDITASLVDAAALRQGIQNAELLCYQNRGTKDAPNAYDCWNWEFDCAQLTYHQLQIFLIDQKFLTKENADAQSIDWCHLHSSCAEAMSNKPKTWSDVMEAAAQRDADRLKQLSFDELKDLTHLRANANGGEFANVNAMINRLISAINGDATLTDWVEVQKALLNGAGGVDTYWWYDGSSSNAQPVNWTALLDKAAPALTPAPYPDGVSRTTKAKLESARSLFEANAAAGQNKATRQWIAVTDNLVAAHREEQVTVVVNGEEMKEWHYTYTPLTDFDDFAAKLVEAMSAANAIGVGYPSWEAVQYHILFPAETLDFINEPWGNVQLLNTDGWDPDKRPPPKQWPEGFWWRGGNVPLTVDSVYTLLQAMRMLNGEDTDAQNRATNALKTVTWERLEGSGFWLRSSKTGEKWTEKPEPDNKTGPLTPAEWQVFKDAQKYGAFNWDGLQYYLAHMNDPDVDVTTLLANMTNVSGEAYYYWWKNDGKGTSMDFTGTSIDKTLLKDLSEASLRGQFGDPLAIQSVQDAAAANGGYKDWLRLTTSPLAYTQEDGRKRDDLAHFADDDGGTAALLAAISDFAVYARKKDKVDIYARPRIMDWYQVQYWILHPELSDDQRYITSGSDPYQEAVNTYWWYKDEEKPAPKPNPVTPVLAQMSNFVATSAKTVTLSNDEWNPMGILKPNNKGVPTAVTTVQAKSYLKTLIAEAKKDPAYYDAGTNTFKLTWSQIQYYIFSASGPTATGTLLSDADAWTALKALDWVKVPEGAVVPASSVIVMFHPLALRYMLKQATATTETTTTRGIAK